MADRGNLVFEDDFNADDLDRKLWFPYYLPHWSEPSTSKANYRIEDGIVRLYVADDQKPWCEEYDGRTRVSNLQTGHVSGPRDSRSGQHRFKSDLKVRSEFPELRLFLPRYCFLEIKARTRLNPWNLAALWLIGFEDKPERSGEITVFELFGHNVTAQEARVGRGIKQINDPNLKTDFDESPIPIDVGDWHRYQIDWTERGVAFGIDDQVVTVSHQSPDYPMQLMLNFYDLDVPKDRTTARDSWLDVDYVRAFAS